MDRFKYREGNDGIPQPSTTCGLTEIVDGMPACRLDVVEIVFLVVGEVFSGERPVVAADLSNTGMCGSIACSLTSHPSFSADPVGSQALRTEPEAIFGAL